jgi:hypothetical protein
VLDAQLVAPVAPSQQGDERSRIDEERLAHASPKPVM